MNKVLIGIPSPGEWKAAFGLSLAHMCLRTEQDVVIASQLGSALSIQRTRIVRAAMEVNATHLLFVDADMIFPSTMLDDLIARDVDVVAANCPVKMVPSQPTARVWRNGKWEMAFTHKGSTGLEKVDRIGTGVMLLKMSIFEKVKEPWFAFLWEGEGGEYQGEDWCLCEQIEAAGYDIWIDHDVSKKIGHVGNFSFWHSMVRPEMLKHPGTEEFRMWADRGVEYGGAKLPGG